MKILVLLKETLATGSKIVLSSPVKIDDSEVQYTTNPYDEHALEEAVRIKEKYGGEIEVLSAGRQDAASILRNALALGADRAVLVIAGVKDSSDTSRVLAETIKERATFDLILAGWTDVEIKDSQVPGRLSEFLQVPLINIVNEIIGIDCAERKITCRREGDGQDEIIEATLPALISVQKNINEPRYPKVQDIIEAGKKKIDMRSANIAADSNDLVIRYTPVRKKRLGVRFDSSDPRKTARALVQKLLESKAL